MNPRPEGIDILTQSHPPDSHYDRVVHHLQDNPSLTYLALTLLTIYFLLNYLRSGSSIVHTLWDILVVITPSRIVAALDSQAAKPDSTEGSLRMDFQAKSAAMQRILGINNTSFASLVTRSRSLSGFGAALLGNKDSVPPGLGNWDNSCYQNSIIQGLASLQSLSAFLGRNIDLLGEKGAFSTHQALREIIGRLNSADSYGQRLWTPADLKSMSSWQQQDAQEYFSKVVDQIDYEVQQATRRQTRNLGLKMAGPAEHVIGAKPKWFDGAQDSNVFSGQQPEQQSFRNPLEGLLAQRVGCMQCGFTEGLSLIPFNCLTVPLGATFECDFRDCLREYMALEPIEGVECAKCTLLKTQKQLQNLIAQAAEDSKLPNKLDSSEMSNIVKKSAEERLQAVDEAIEENDFAEKTLSNKCHIPSKSRVSSTKSRQAVIARPPKCLAIHINRSLFDEQTFSLSKNYANVNFPSLFNLSEWCLGAGSMEQAEHPETWDTDPRESMLPPMNKVADTQGRYYELRAVITHYGRHENGHYICYRKYPTDTFPAQVPDSILEADGEKDKPERWYRLSDDDVQMVSEASVMSQGGAFMLFYEAVEKENLPSISTLPATTEEPDLTEESSASNSSLSCSTPEDNRSMTTAAATESATGSVATSPATSASGPEKAGEESERGSMMLDVD